jgi:hypothetical protein
MRQIQELTKKYGKTLANGHVSLGLVRSCERLTLGETNSESLENFYFAITEDTGTSSDAATGNAASGKEA